MRSEILHECKVVGLSILLAGFPAFLCILFWWIT